MLIMMLMNGGWRSLAKPNILMKIKVNEKGLLGEACDVSETYQLSD